MIVEKAVKFHELPLAFRRTTVAPFMNAVSRFSSPMERPTEAEFTKAFAMEFVVEID